MLIENFIRQKVREVRLSLNCPIDYLHSASVRLLLLYQGQRGKCPNMFRGLTLILAYTLRMIATYSVRPHRILLFYLLFFAHSGLRIKKFSWLLHMLNFDPGPLFWNRFVKPDLSIEMIANLRLDSCKRSPIELRALLLLEIYCNLDFSIFACLESELSACYNSVELNEIITLLGNVFREYGRHREAESLEMVWLNKLDPEFNILKTKVNTKFFQNVGHISLVDYLIRAAILDGSSFEKLNLGYRSSHLSKINPVLVEIITKNLESMGLNVFPFDGPNMSAFDNLECIWDRDNHWQPFLRRLSGIENKWLETYGSFSLAIPDDLLGEAWETLRQVTGLQPEWIVGIHLRKSISGIEKINRNVDNSNYIMGLRYLLDLGATVIATGDTKLTEFFSARDAIFDVSKLNIPLRSKNLLELIAYRESSFFIGNLSGGTNPPRLFGTPTIWTDYFPIIHHRPPRIADYCLPKKLRRIGDSGTLSILEAISVTDSGVQSESVWRTIEAGFEAVAHSEESLLEAFQIVYEIEVKGRCRQEYINLNRLNASFDQTIQNYDLYPGAYIIEVN